VELRGIGKTYRAQAAVGGAEAHDVAVLDGVDLSIERGERIAIMGRSGSGKSTLLNILGCLDAPTTGEYLLEGRPVTHLDDEALSRVRNTSFGFVFQSFHLLAGLNILENVMLPLEYARERSSASASSSAAHRGDARARELLAMVGLAHRFTHRPNQLSGGERQRVAIARALVNEPRMLLADEPTGALDSKSQGAILELFATVHERFGTALVVVTHDPKVASGLGGRTLHMLDGRMALQ
jgi:putative ABC transport system ATP-binding protein